AGQRGAHFLITVKGNQPSLHARLAALPWQVPVAHDAREKGHGRAERRALKVTAVAAGLVFPHTAQAIQIVRPRARAAPIKITSSLTCATSPRARLARTQRPGCWRTRGGCVVQLLVDIDPDGVDFDLACVNRDGAA